MKRLLTLCVFACLLAASRAWASCVDVTALCGPNFLPCMTLTATSFLLPSGSAGSCVFNPAFTGTAAFCLADVQNDLADCNIEAAMGLRTCFAQGIGPVGAFIYLQRDSSTGVQDEFVAGVNAPCATPPPPPVMLIPPGTLTFVDYNSYNPSVGATCGSPINWSAAHNLHFHLTGLRTTSSSGTALATYEGIVVTSQETTPQIWVSPCDDTLGQHLKYTDNGDGTMEVYIAPTSSAHSYTFTVSYLDRTQQIMNVTVPGAITIP